MAISERKISKQTSVKQTEIGLIPEDWDVHILANEIDQLEAGVSVNSIEEELNTRINEPAILKTSAVSNGFFIPLENKKIIPRDIKRAKLKPRFNSIIISRMNTPDLVGECGYVEKDYDNLFLPDRLWMTRLKKESQINVKWLSYLLSSKKYKAKIKDTATGTSGSMKNISKNSLLSISIPFPSPKEQQAIAAALSDVDALITSLDKLIAKKRDIKQATMQELLMGKTRLPGFSGEWETKKLSERCEFYSGGTPKTAITSFYGGSISWITSSDLNKGRIKEVEGRITKLGLENSSAQMVKKGTLLLALYGATAGVTAITEIDAAINQAVLAIIPQQDYSDFLFQKLTLLKNWLIKTYTQGGQPNLSGQIVKSIEFSLPCKSEQIAIAKVLSDMDAEIVALEQKRDKTRALKQGMMQELLTGKTRLYEHSGPDRAHDAESSGQSPQHATEL